MPAHRNSILSLLRSVNHRPTSTLRTTRDRQDEHHHPSSRYSGPWSAHQRRWARVQDPHPRFLATHELKKRKEEEIIARYKQKLEGKAKEEGLTSIADLKEQYQDKIKALRKKASVAGVTEGSSATGPAEEPTAPKGILKQQSSFPETESIPSEPGPAKSKSPYPAPPPPPVPQDTQAPSLPPGIKPLSSYLDVDKVRTLSAEQIQELWKLRHSRDERALIAAVPLKSYTTMMKLAQQHPQFVLPVPREGTGAEIHFMQWATYGSLPPSSMEQPSGAPPLPHTATVLFTHLAEFKLRGEYATPHTTVTLHADLLPEKGLVLAVGNVQENRNVSMDDAKWLLMCLQRFYGMERAEVRGKLLKQFSQGDAGFDVQELMDEAERMG